MDGFEYVEATVESVHRALADGSLTVVQLVDGYLRRIDAFDRSGPALNAVITVNPHVREQAESLDRAYAANGPTGPLHGVPVLIKDQIDAEGMPTTLGSIHLQHFHPGRDAALVRLLEEAGALVLAKVSLGELGGGDAHGTLFGSTRNPYGLDRTPGGSSGGTGAAVAANLGLVGIGQEGYASIRRPAAWNALVGLRPSAGMISRDGAFAGWPGMSGALGPMTRTVTDLARLMEVLVAYDPADPLTALGAPHAPMDGLVASLDPRALEGARIGVLRQTMGNGSDPEADDFREILRVFDRSVAELAACGAEVVDPIEIPGLLALLGRRTSSDRCGTEAAFAWYLRGIEDPPFATFAELLAVPGYEPLGSITDSAPPWSLDHIEAREQLHLEVMKVMADHRLDAIAYRTVEHEPTLLAPEAGPDGRSRKRTNMRGGTHLNTFLVHVPSLSVPAGFLDNGLPCGLGLLGRPYDDARLIRYAYAYEQATDHRRSPATAPEL